MLASITVVGLETVLDIGQSNSGISVSLDNTGSVSTQDIVTVTASADQGLSVLNMAGAVLHAKSTFLPAESVDQGVLDGSGSGSSSVEQVLTLAILLGVEEVVADDTVVPCVFEAQPAIGQAVLVCVLGGGCLDSEGGDEQDECPFGMCWTFIGVGLFFDRFLHVLIFFLLF
jgi:hypothetical protein